MADQESTRKDVILARLAAGRTFMGPHRAKAMNCARRYLDPSARALSPGADTAQDGATQPVGEANYIAINIRQKVSSIAIGVPDFTIKTSKTPEHALVVRDFLRESWRKGRWGRLFRRVATQRCIAGMAWVAYRWDRQKGFEMEFVNPDDLIFDPHVTEETWDNPRWAAREINIPVEVAHARWGETVFALADTNSGFEYSSRFIAEERERKGYRVTVYWDEFTEAVFYGSTLLESGKNHYGRVPIRTFQGDPNPNGEFALGDFDTSLGVFELQRRMMLILNELALHGGGVPWMREDMINEKQRQAVMDGTLRGYVLVNGVQGSEAIGYTANQPLNPAVLEAMRMMGHALDADQGVGDYDRGVLTENPRFASQVVTMANRSGSRGNLVRADFELFVESLMRDDIELTAKFGLDPEQGEVTDEAQILWQACSDVYDLRVVEESLGFKDPAAVQQQNLQLLREAIQALEPMAATTGVIPNLRTLFDDVLRSFDRKNDLEKYYLEAPAPPQPPEGEALPVGEGPPPQAGGAGADPSAGLMM